MAVGKGSIERAVKANTEGIRTEGAAETVEMEKKPQEEKKPAARKMPGKKAPAKKAAGKQTPVPKPEKPENIHEEKFQVISRIKSDLPVHLL